MHGVRPTERAAVEIRYGRLQSNGRPEVADQSGYSRRIRSVFEPFFTRALVVGLISFLARTGRPSRDIAA
jgi:hypothetical protein